MSVQPVVGVGSSISLICIVLLRVFGIAGSSLPSHSIVSTDSGPVRGQLLRTIIENKPYYAFKGIPYAEPPSFDRRFLPPEPVRRWTATRDTFAFGSICLQYNPIAKNELVGSEDCLYLNVYTPPAEPPATRTTLRTVMVYIHGGGFFFGSGNDDLQGPDLLVNENVVLVTLNYRLGVLGFMSLGTAEYSGNQGLKDQQLALKWIHTNIQQFGGDPKRITIFGQSAGSASCLLHMIAPGSRGLFQQTIQMSSTFDIWSAFEPAHHLEDMRRFAAKHNVTPITDNQLIPFLKQLDPRQIVAAFPIVQFHPDRTPIVITSKWLPVVENARALQPFIQLHPTEMLLMSSFDINVNVMTGYTTAESLFFNAPVCHHPELLDTINENFAIELPSMRFKADFNSSEYRAVAAQIREFYFPNGVAINANPDTIRSFVQLMSHVYENYPIERRARLMARQSNGSVFFYRFGLESELNYYKRSLRVDGVAGAAHADDICYLFYCKYIEQVYVDVRPGTRKYELIKMMTELYVNFARHSNPLHPHALLEPVRWDRLNFVDIAAGGPVADAEPLAGPMEFWSKLMQDHPKLLAAGPDEYRDLLISAVRNGE